MEIEIYEHEDGYFHIYVNGYRTLFYISREVGLDYYVLKNQNLLKDIIINQFHGHTKIDREIRFKSKEDAKNFKDYLESINIMNELAGE